MFLILFQYRSSCEYEKRFNGGWIVPLSTSYHLSVLCLASIFPSSRSCLLQYGLLGSPEIENSSSAVKVSETIPIILLEKQTLEATSYLLLPMALYSPFASPSPRAY
jgi:hypothetical protein